MFVVDTNVLVYAANESVAEHGACRRLIDGWRVRGPAWYATWGILYEFLRVVTHPRVFPEPWTGRRAWGFVEALLAAPSFGLLVETDRHRAVARAVFDEIQVIAGNVVHDAHTAVLMREHGIRMIYTRDADFRRFPFIEVRDPTA